MISLAALALLAASAAPVPLQLKVDLSDAPRRIIRATETIQARPGPLTLVYPKWIPGEHGPTGPLADLSGLRFSAGGQPLAWRRDGEDLFAFTVEVPPGATRVEVAMEVLEPPAGTDGFSSGASISQRLAVLSWNHVVLYPRGLDPRFLPFDASLVLPAGWSLGTALPIRASDGTRTEFATASLETLIDSPVLAGRHLRRYPIGPAEGTPHAIVLAAESAEAAVLPPEFKAQLDRLVLEAEAMFGARHYRGYTFLLTLSDQVAHFGLEHHECSDDRVGERWLLQPELRPLVGALLTHEYVHSWNGKHRRPAGLATRDYQQPMQGELLWVYEGLTQYLGEVLAARTGLSGENGFRDGLALAAGTTGQHPGRAWRPLADTAVAASVLYGARGDGQSARRGVDFYDEGSLLWLEVDTILRLKSDGRRSLDDFLHDFLGGKGGGPSVRPYRLEEVVAGLMAVVPFDWRAFFATRVERLRPASPIEGIEAAGWKLVWTPEPTARQKDDETASEATDLTGSLGLVLAKEGRIQDVLPGSPAARAGVPSGAKLLGVEGRTLTKERLADALAATARGQPMELLLQDADVFVTAKLDYRDGPRYPALARDTARPDLLAAIAAPRTAPASPPTATPDRP
jgi:predicted metalloprotease with PDZ domain